MKRRILHAWPRSSPACNAQNRQNSATAGHCIASNSWRPRARWSVRRPSGPRPTRPVCHARAPSRAGPSVQRWPRYPVQRAARHPGLRAQGVRRVGRERAGRHDRPSGLPDDQPGSTASARQPRVHRFHRGAGARAAARHPASLSEGSAAAWRRLRDFFASLAKKFNGFAAERFNTVLPLCCGPYAVRVRLKPVGNPPPAARSRDIAEDMRERLAVGPVQWDLELQFFVDEATTPIEDASRPGRTQRRPSSRWRGSACRSRASMRPRWRPNVPSSIPGAASPHIGRWAR